MARRRHRRLRRERPADSTRELVEDLAPASTLYEEFHPLGRQTTQRLSVESIPITNRSSAEILVALEPEGETHALAPGQVCRITARPDLGAAQDLEFEIEIGDGVVSVYLVCEKEVTIAESR